MFRRRRQAIAAGLLYAASAVLGSGAVGPLVTGSGTPLGATARVAAAVAPALEAAAVTATLSSGRCATPRRPAPSGWRRVMVDSFSQDIPLGKWGRPGSRFEFPGGMWKAREAGAKDTSGRGTYNSMKTTSQHNGLLDVWVHSENGTRYVAALLPLVGDRRAMRVSICMRAGFIPGYKIAYMLWPDDGPGNFHGEIDYPETKLLRSDQANAFMHYDPKPSSGRAQDWFGTGRNVYHWHVYTMSWRPSTDCVVFSVDDRSIGKSCKPEVPNGPMHYIMQIETYPRDPLPAPRSGHVYADWITIDVPR